METKMLMRVLAALAALFCSSAYAEPACEFDPSESLKKMVVRIERMFDPDEVFVNKRYETIYGSGGTAWFLRDNKTMVTIGHVAEGAKLTKSWKEVTLFWSEEKDTKANKSFVTQVRVKDVVVGHPALEPLVVLELEAPLAGAQRAKVLERPLARNEQVVALGYTRSVLRFVQGRLAWPEPSAEPSSSGTPPPPYLPFEMVDREKKEGIGDRYALDHGSSGSPIFDCNGEVAAVVQGFYNKPMSFLSHTIVTTTPWGHANITAVPAATLLTLKK